MTWEWSKYSTPWVVYIITGRNKKNMRETTWEWSKYSTPRVVYIITGRNKNRHEGDDLGVLKMQYTPWASYQIRIIAGCAYAGIDGDVSPATDFKENR